MPYKPKAQRKFMHIHNPKIAARWDKVYDVKIGGGKEIGNH
jgi:hypothetical protein